MQSLMIDWWSTYRLTTVGILLMYIHTTTQNYWYKFIYNIQWKYMCGKDTYIFTQTQPIRFTHLPTGPSPPSAWLCRTCRPSPAARCRCSPSSRRRRPSAGRTYGRDQRRGRRRLRRDAEGGEASVYYMCILSGVTCKYVQFNIRYIRFENLWWFNM